jgi:hypothetical protein
MTQEIIRAELSAIRLITKGFQVAAATQDEQGQWHTFAANKSAMVSLNDCPKFGNGRSHTFGKLLKWAKEENPYATHIVAFTNVPNEEPLILLKVRD